MSYPNASLSQKHATSSSQAHQLSKREDESESLSLLATDMEKKNTNSNL